jgi:hypothetical protein
MKKLTAIVLSAILLLSAISLASCAKPTTASIYAKATEKLLDIDAVEMNTSMTIEMSAEDQTISMDMDYGIKSKGRKTEAPTAYADIKMSMLGQTVDVTAYAEGDYVYISTMGEGIKLPKDSETAGGYDIEATMNAFEIEVPAQFLESTEFTTDEEGNYILSFTFNGNEHADILKKFTDNVMSGLGSSLSEYELSIGEVKYELVIDKDYMMKNMNLEMTMDITTSGITMKTSVTAEGEYVAFNDGVTITPPEGYQSYEEWVE